MTDEATRSTACVLCECNCGAGCASAELTSTDWKDPFAGTPWHKHIPARLDGILS